MARGERRRQRRRRASADGEQGRGETTEAHGQGCCLHPHLDGLEAARCHGGASETSTNTHHHAISNPTSLSTTVRTSNHPTKANPSQAVRHDEGPATILVSWGGCSLWPHGFAVSRARSFRRWECNPRHRLRAVLSARGVRSDRRKDSDRGERER